MKLKRANFGILHKLAYFNVGQFRDLYVSHPTYFRDLYVWPVSLAQLFNDGKQTFN